MRCVFTMGSAIVEEILGALQATISVLLVLAYGGLSVKWLKIVSAGCIDEVTKLGINVFLPGMCKRASCRRYS